LISTADEQILNISDITTEYLMKPEDTIQFKKLVLYVNKLIQWIDNR